MELEIRKFETGDIDIVYDIQREAYRPLWEKYHDDDTNPYMESKQDVLRKYTREGTQGYVFYMDGTAVGAVRISVDPEYRCGRVSALGVLPRFQGLGIAQTALRAIEEMHGDVVKWKLDTILEEKGNCHLYEKLGYVRTGQTEKVNDRLTLVFYQKKLNG